MKLSIEAFIFPFLLKSGALCVIIGVAMALFGRDAFSFSEADNLIGAF